LAVAEEKRGLENKKKTEKLQSLVQCKKKGVSHIRAKKNEKAVMKKK